MNKSTNGNVSMKRTLFEQQRHVLMSEIHTNMESVLQNLNKLNRNLEGIIAVGGDFAKVEDLWAQFENFMGPQDNNINSEVNQQEEHKS